MRHDLSDHLGVFDGNRQSLLLDRFPIDAAELIDLIDQLLDDRGLYLVVTIRAGDSQFNREGETIHGIELCVLVTGIVEAVTNEVKADVLSVIVGLVVSGALSFLAVKVFRILTIKKQLNYFGIYDISFGVIAAVIGIFQLILR